MSEEVYFYVAIIYVEKSKTETYSAVNLWDYPNTNHKTDKDEINSILAKGWQLVSTTPINIEGNTTELLFTFKRKKLT